MRKKSSTTIKLVLISSILASCGNNTTDTKPTQASAQQRVFMRADSTATYTEVTDNYQQGRSHGGGMGASLLWFMAFRHMGGAMGYANSSIHPSSVAGNNVRKAAAFKAQRGGFGQSMSRSSVGS